MMLLWIAIGGALGAMARYGLGGWVHSWAGNRLPWGTLAVNVIGSFLIGFLFRWLQSATVAPEMRLFVSVGLLGAFTTFSAYSLETVVMMRAGEWRAASLYSVASLGLGVAAVWAGLAIADLLVRGTGTGA